MDEQETLRRFAAELLDKRRHIAACRAPDRISDKSGIYAILALEAPCIPPPFGEYLARRSHLCLYVGKAVKGLRRLVRYDLRGEGPSTFFCSLGLVLGYRITKRLNAGVRRHAIQEFERCDTANVGIPRRTS